VCNELLGTKDIQLVFSVLSYARAF